MSTQDKVLDRTFDAACLTVRKETEWGKQIINRLKANYPENADYIDNTFNFYVTMVTHNPDFLSRADYLIEHKKTVRLRF